MCSVKNWEYSLARKSVLNGQYKLTKNIFGLNMKLASSRIFELRRLSPI